MTRKRLGILLIVVSALPFVGQIAGLLAVGAAGCTGSDCAWLTTPLGRLAGSAVNAGGWVIFTAPIGLIGLVLLIVDGLKSSDKAG